MEKVMTIRGKDFYIKYEGGIVSVRPSESIGWATSQTIPKHNLTEEQIGEMAREIVRGLGLA